MFAGLPWSSWLLLIAAVGLGPAIVYLYAFCNRRRETQEKTQSQVDGEEPN